MGGSKFKAQQKEKYDVPTGAKKSFTPQNNTCTYTYTWREFQVQVSTETKHSCPSSYINEERERERKLSTVATNQPFLKNLTVTHLTILFSL